MKWIRFRFNNGWLFAVGGKTEYHFAETTEVAAHMDIETGNGIDPSKSGIDHLLRASSVNRSASLEGLEYGPQPTSNSLD